MSKIVSLTMLLFFLSCNFNPTEISEKVLISLQKEKDAYVALVELNKKIKDAPSQSEAKRNLLVENTKLFKNYLDILYSLEESLQPIKSKSRSRVEYDIEGFLKNSKNDTKKNQAIETFSKIWDEKNRDLLNSFLTREGTLQLQLPSWALENVEKQVQDISFLQYQRRGVLKVSFSENLIPFLNMIFGPNKFTDLTEIFSLEIVSDVDFANTLPMCRLYTQSLVDEDCRSDASKACGPQMTESCVREVLVQYKNADCRKRKRKYLTDEIIYVETTRFDKLPNGSSEELVEALRACDFKELVF